MEFYSTVFKTEYQKLQHLQTCCDTYREMYNNQKIICNSDAATSAQFEELERLRIIWSQSADKVSEQLTVIAGASKHEDELNAKQLLESYASMDHRLTVFRLDNEALTSRKDTLIRECNQAYEQLRILKQVFKKLELYINIVPATNNLTELEALELEVKPIGRPRKEDDSTQNLIQKHTLELFAHQYSAYESLINKKFIH